MDHHALVVQVDAQDLSLNVSREILQQDRQIQLIRRRLVKKVLSTVKSMMTTEPEKYQTFWAEFGRTIKEGLLSDYENREAILDIASFASTNDAEQLTTLRQYVDRMKDDQEDIYYLTGETRSAMENSPHMEALRAKGVEVLLLTDSIDEMWVDAVGSFDGKQLQSIAKGQVDLGADEEDETAQAEHEQRKQDFSGLLPWMTEKLGDTVKEVRLSSRLTTSPACIVGDTYDMTPTLEKMYRAMGQDVPSIKRILELNPDHKLVTRLREAHAARPDDEELAQMAELLYGMALLAEGGELPNPAHFTAVLASQLEKTL